MTVGSASCTRDKRCPRCFASEAESTQRLWLVDVVKAVVRLIRRESEETIMWMAAGWLHRSAGRRALAPGFWAEVHVEEIVHVYIDDEVSGRDGAAAP